jgi:flagellar hook assembly protein FlgD
VGGSSGELPGAFSLANSYPNPFNAETVISFTLARPANIELSIFNALGRKVKSLSWGLQLAGTREIRWDGRMENGSEAPSGVYFYRLSDSSHQETKKMLLLR